MCRDILFLAGRYDSDERMVADARETLRESQELDADTRARRSATSRALAQSRELERSASPMLAASERTLAESQAVRAAVRRRERNALGCVLVVVFCVVYIWCRKL